MGYEKGTAPSGRTVNRLNVGQMFKVCRWLEDLQPTFDHTTTKEALAVKATNYFGFEVNQHNIGTCLETAEISLPKPPKSDVQKLGILKRAVETLYKKLGEQLPPEWSDL